MGTKFKLVGLGGTFDRLHLGHERMLDKAFEIGEKVVIGLTVDEVIKRKPYSSLILPYDKRLSTIKKFLKSRGYSGRAEIVTIDDDFGNYKGKGGVDKQEGLEALVVSFEQKVTKMAEKINQARAKNNLKPICIIEVPIVMVGGKAVSSTLIREPLAKKAGRKDLEKYTNYPEG